MKKQILLLMLFALCFSVSAQKQVFVMEGTVYDETGVTLPGATIFVKEKTGIGTTSDGMGKFSIRAEYGDKIIFSFVGYENIEYLVIEESKTLEIRMSVGAQQMEEVVVTG